MDVYPDNTMAHFKTKLPNRVELDGRWEVGLVEMQYPHTWYNLREGEGEMTIVDSSETVVWHVGGNIKHSKSLPVG